jgi:hypothetical protein
MPKRRRGPPRVEYPDGDYLLRLAMEARQARNNVGSPAHCQYRSKLPQNHRLKLPHLNDERADETQDVHEFEVTSLA